MGLRVDSTAAFVLISNIQILNVIQNHLLFMLQPLHLDVTVCVLLVCVDLCCVIEDDLQVCYASSFCRIPQYI